MGGVAHAMPLCMQIDTYYIYKKWKVYVCIYVLGMTSSKTGSQVLA